MNAEPQPSPEPTPPPAPGAGPPAGRRPVLTRAGMAWTATIAALVLLILLIAFIVQNQDAARVRFFGLDGTISLGIALLIAAVGGGALVAIAGAVRIIQLRTRTRRTPATRR
ncbi:lipopolysaccharide assembly protein LapA domain-containing protein [Arthrobacter sp. SRS-W-1-2016]|uniref:lipopolysaccharide assembly protein LapA domain-containing protein n=1 Tax=Arthrobacter sp. SRS-W-1-2016 TaxID=1930254 RepID=UPI00209B19BE|nr:lipopolysaccharide assembly protein LapA domain-containing protein [Arthrobacter sp. SRS-W-1-2016]